MSNEREDKQGEVIQPVLVGGIPKPFAVYEDFDGRLHIIDGRGRIVLSDAYAYDAGTDATDVRMDALADALNASASSSCAARCPLGLDDTPTICSAATCASCKAWREYIARSSSTRAEAALVKIKTRHCTNPQPIGDSACDCCAHHWYAAEQALSATTATEVHSTHVPPKKT